MATRSKSASCSSCGTRRRPTGRYVIGYPFMPPLTTPRDLCDRCVVEMRTMNVEVLAVPAVELSSEAP